MAEDLRGTRPVDRGGGAADGSTANGGERQRQRERFAEDLRGRELSARSPQVDASSGEAGHPIPVRRWSSQAHSVPEIERELNKIWGSGALRATGDGEHHVAARSSVLNLVVVAPQPEIAERCVATITRMMGRHPSRTLILSSLDGEGPGGLEAQIEAHCVLPPSGGAETCAEMIYITTSGETSRHLAAIIVPLLVHDLPVALWWPNDPLFRSHRADRLLPMADRLIVDGSSWSGNGLDRLLEMTEVAAKRGIVVADFALIRQARWREALASSYDTAELRPHLRGMRSILVDYAASEEGDPGGLTNVVKPVYHVAWLGSRLGMNVTQPLSLGQDGARTALLRQRDHEVRVTLRPVQSKMPPGTTLRVELGSQHARHELVADVTAERETVEVVATEAGEERLHRTYLAPRLGATDLLGVAVEESAPDPVAVDALAFAACLMTAGPMPRRHSRLPRAGARGETSERQ